MNTGFRIGNGFDIHRLAEGRKLVLAGVTIPYEKGLTGHSDADVLTHAIIDSILGGLAMGDIGKMFPDTDVAYKNMNSLDLLQKVMFFLDSSDYAIANVDANIIAQEPKMQPYINSMREILSKSLSVDITQVSIKAKTMEELGPIGNKEAIAATCITLLYRKFN